MTSRPGPQPRSAEELLRRVFVPREFNGAFMTLDKTEYRRDRTTGTIRRATPKLKGKARRRAERLARRLKRGDDS